MRAAHSFGLVLGAALAAGCFDVRAGTLADDPDAPWTPGLPIAKQFAGLLDLDSTPSGAEATTSLGGSCRTPCSLEVTAEGPFTITFTHEGYEPTTLTVKILHAKMGVSERQFAPNPVLASLAPAEPPAPPPPPPKKPVARRTPPHAVPKRPVAPAPPPAVTPKPIFMVPSYVLPEATPKPVVTAPPHVMPEKPVATTPPPEPAPKNPVAATPPAAKPMPAPPAWPTEVKPLDGINAGPIVPRDPPRSRDNPVARRWIDSVDKPAADQDADKKKKD
jgi:PEGA domain